MLTRNFAFTLIELLITVAIIGILALVAVPNLLEAQVKAKVSRAKTDLRSIATAIEAYNLDHNAYPPMYEVGFTGGVPALQGSGLKWWYIPNVLSTPIAYLTSSAIWCPFGGNWDKAPYFPDKIWRRYGYENITELIEAAKNWSILRIRYFPGLIEHTGKWRLQCVGPDRWWNPSVLYDPSNGTVSGGDIIRTQLDTTGNKSPQLPFPN